MSTDQFLKIKNRTQIESLLLTQVELISKDLERQKEKAPFFQFSPSILAQNASIQVIDDEGKIFWDFKNKERIHTKLLGKNALFEEAKLSNHEKSIFVFQNSNAISFLGAYQQAIPHYFVIAAIATPYLASDAELMNKLMVICLFFMGFSFLLIGIFSSSIPKQNLAPLQPLTPQPPPELKEFTRPIIASPIRSETSNLVQLQQKLLPNSEIRTARYEIQSYYQPSPEVLSDCWGYFETHDFLVLYIGETGTNAMKNAMLAATIKGCFSAINQIMMVKHDLKMLPSQILTYFNQAISLDDQSDYNMSMFVAVYSFPEQTLKFASAGKSPAWVFRNRVGESKVEILQSEGPRLGESLEFKAPADQQVTLSENDVLFLYTDGLINATNLQNEPYGSDRVKNLMADTLEYQLSLVMLKEALAKDMKIFTEKQNLKDDLTFAILKLRPSWERNSG